MFRELAAVVAGREYAKSLQGEIEKYTENINAAR